METMQAYVVRKLKEPYINRVGVCKMTRLSRDTIDRLTKGSQATAQTVQTLHDFFKKINE